MKNRKHGLWRKAGDRKPLPDQDRMEEIRRNIFLFYDNRASSEHLIKLSLGISVFAILLSLLGLLLQFSQDRS